MMHQVEVCAPAQTSGVKNLVSTRFFTFRTGNDERNVGHRSEGFINAGQEYFTESTATETVCEGCEHVCRSHRLCDHILDGPACDYDGARGGMRDGGTSA